MEPARPSLMKLARAIDDAVEAHRPELQVSLRSQDMGSSANTTLHSIIA